MSLPLTDADRARVQAYEEAYRNAISAIPESEFEYNRIRVVEKAVDKTHPVNQDMRKAYNAERIAKMAELLVLPNAPFLEPNAPWGLAVYRVSYSDDAAWGRILSVLRQDVETTFATRPDQLDILSRHELVLIADQSKFDGAGPEEIRKHFESWSMDELQRNWRVDQGAVAKDEITLFLAGPRYNFCLLVDDICLESLEKMSKPVVKLVNRNWAPDSEPDEADEDDVEDEKLDWEGGGTNNDHEDVGWMYLETVDYIDIQNELRDDNWADMYVRPPLMRWVDDFDEAPGFWRRSASSA